MTEFELKFQVPPERAEGVERALRRAPVDKQQMRARYFDTQDGALERAGIALRIRREGRRWVQTAKGAGRGGFERLEHNAPVPAARAKDLPDLARHAGHPLHDLLLQALRDRAAALQVVFETDIVREMRIVSASGARIELALDRGEIRAAGRTHPVAELEFELKEGPPGVLIELARRWCHEHDLWLDPLTKAGMGRRLARGDAIPAPLSASAPQGKGRHLRAAILDAALHQVLGEARELAAGQGTDEHVHQLRVGLRRLRAALRELHAPDSEGAPQDVPPALRDLFSLLGSHRDLSTVLPAWLKQVADAGAAIAPWKPSLPDLGAAVRTNAVQDAFLSLVALSESLREGEGVPPRQLRALASARLDTLHRQALRTGRHFEDLTLEERHRVRKRLKRQRYLAELVRPLYAGSEVDAYVDALKAAQESLGQYQDAIASRALFEQHAAKDPQAWFGAGWIAAQEAALARDCAKACRRAARAAKPFWG